MEETNKNGLKYDNGKLRWSLVISKYSEGLVKALMFGAEKYKENSWQGVENGRERYYNALRRHLNKLQKPEGGLDLNAIDPESGLPHIAHIQANAYFLEYFRLKEIKESTFPAPIESDVYLEQS